MDAYEKVLMMYESIRAKIPFAPKVALVLGSGLGDFADTVEAVAVIDYADIEGFPRSTVVGHKGRFVFAYVEGVPVVMMQGRVHFYEGYPIQDVVLPTRLMKLFGAEILFLTNAAGGVQKGMSAGDFMLITDHISSFVPNPLLGRNNDNLGVRFPDMSEVYDKDLRQKIRDAATSQNIDLREGVYCQLTGPTYETPAEIRMYATMGADAVGMSTAVEAIAAKHAGMRVCGISMLSNLAAGINPTPLSHEEVEEVAKSVAPKFKTLVRYSIANMK